MKTTFKNYGRLMASFVVITLLLVTGAVALAAPSKVFDTSTGAEIGTVDETGSCKYVGQDKLVCPGTPAQNTQLCIEAANADETCAADSACVLSATQECVSALESTVASGAQLTGGHVGILIPSSEQCPSEPFQAIATNEGATPIHWARPPQQCGLVIGEDIPGNNFGQSDRMTVVIEKGSGATRAQGIWDFAEGTSAGDRMTSLVLMSECDVQSVSDDLFVEVVEDCGAYCEYRFCIYGPSPRGY